MRKVPLWASYPFSSSFNMSGLCVTLRRWMSMGDCFFPPHAGYLVGQCIWSKAPSVSRCKITKLKILSLCKKWAGMLHIIQVRCDLARSICSYLARVGTSSRTITLLVRLARAELTCSNPQYTPCGCLYELVMSPESDCVYPGIWHIGIARCQGDPGATELA